MAFSILLSFCEVKWMDAICLIAAVVTFVVEMLAWVCTMIPPPIELTPPFECSPFCQARLH